MILSIADVAQYKKEIEEKFSAKIHFHDGCGGQYFTADKPSEELKALISEYFTSKKLKAVFSESGEHFTVERNL